MKKTIILLVLLGLAILIGSFMAKDAGYVLIAYHTLRLETSLWVAVILLVLVFILAYLLVRLLYHTKTLPRKLKRWNAQTRQKQISKVANSGMTAYLEENFKIAEKFFSQASQIEPQTLLYYIFAAKSAQAQKRYKNRDSYLAKVPLHAKNIEFSIQLIRANLYLDANQSELALGLLNQLRKQHSKNPYIVRQLCTLYKMRDDFEQLKSLLIPLKKLKALPTDEIIKIENTVYQNLLKQSHTSFHRLQSIWKSMPKYLQQDTSLLKTYVEYLFGHNEKLTALTLIEKQLKRQWHGDLIRLYSQHAYKNVDMQLKTTQKWLSSHPSDFMLFFTIGRLYCHNHQWLQAKHYLEKSIEISPEPFIYQLLGHVEEQLGHKDNALLCYRNSFIN